MVQATPPAPATIDSCSATTLRSRGRHGCEWTAAVRPHLTTARKRGGKRQKLVRTGYKVDSLSQRGNVGMIGNANLAAHECSLRVAWRRGASSCGTAAAPDAGPKQSAEYASTRADIPSRPPRADARRLRLRPQPRGRLHTGCAGLVERCVARARHEHREQRLRLLRRDLAFAGQCQLRRSVLRVRSPIEDLAAMVQVQERGGVWLEHDDDDHSRDYGGAVDHRGRSGMAHHDNHDAVPIQGRHLGWSGVSARLCLGICFGGSRGRFGGSELAGRTRPPDRTSGQPEVHGRAV